MLHLKEANMAASSTPIIILVIELLSPYLAKKYFKNFTEKNSIKNYQLKDLKKIKKSKILKRKLQNYAKGEKYLATVMLLIFIAVQFFISALFISKPYLVIITLLGGFFLSIGPMSLITQKIITSYAKLFDKQINPRYFQYSQIGFYDYGYIDKYNVEKAVFNEKRDVFTPNIIFAKRLTLAYILFLIITCFLYFFLI
jgi:hypothetical protein